MKKIDEELGQVGRSGLHILTSQWTLGFVNNARKTFYRKEEHLKLLWSSPPFVFFKDSSRIVSFYSLFNERKYIISLGIIEENVEISLV